MLQQTKEHHRQPTNKIVLQSSHLTNIAKADSSTQY